MRFAIPNRATTPAGVLRYLNDPTLADAILDRVVHSSHKIELQGTRSMRDADAPAAT